MQEEPLAAEVEARVRQEAEREALKQIAMQEGERLPDVDEEAALDEAGDEALDDYDDGEVRYLFVVHFLYLSLFCQHSGARNKERRFTFSVVTCKCLVSAIDAGTVLEVHAWR